MSTAESERPVAVPLSIARADMKAEHAIGCLSSLLKASLMTPKMSPPDRSLPLGHDELQALQRRKKSKGSPPAKDPPQAPIKAAEDLLQKNVLVSTLPPPRPATMPVAVDEAPRMPDDISGLDSLELRVTDTSIKVRSIKVI